MIIPVDGSPEGGAWMIFGVKCCMMTGYGWMTPIASDCFPG